jgi:hypothetical protein
LFAIIIVMADRRRQCFRGFAQRSLKQCEFARERGGLTAVPRRGERAKEERESKHPSERNAAVGSEADAGTPLVALSPFRALTHRAQTFVARYFTKSEPTILVQASRTPNEFGSARPAAATESEATVYFVRSRSPMRTILEQTPRLGAPDDIVQPSANPIQIALRDCGGCSLRNNGG